MESSPQLPVTVFLSTPATTVRPPVRNSMSRGVLPWTPANLYIADSFNSRIRKVTTEGIISTVAGIGVSGCSGDGGRARPLMRCWEPSGVAMDTSGNLYIADTGNSRIRKVTSDGIITTVAGNVVGGYSGDGGPATSAQLAGPRGVTVDTSRNLYIADTGNSRIRKVTTGNHLHGCR